MRLHTLKLECWRGVDSRQLELSGGVTLIEGPNEIGKSTIVEAVRMLFSEMDSSKKKNVKSIQPVGQDIGSSVEAEVTAGDYHFVYAKTYNRTPQTSLDILAPIKRQLTGREAHEEVERILGESVDLALWDALLVEQGEKVALANFQDSAGLAKALDEAAGSGQAGGEDTGLYTLVQSEYENYFTLKTGKSRLSGQETAYQRSKVALEEARQALDKVQQDASDHERCAAEVRRLTALLPGLETRMSEHQKEWTKVNALKEQTDRKEKELKSAQVLHQSASETLRDRFDLIREIERSDKDLDRVNGRIEPLQSRSGLLKARIKNTRERITQLKQEQRTARAALDLAQADEEQIRKLTLLADNEERLKQHTRISKKLKAELKTVASITIDETILKRFRAAELQLAIASGKRESASTVITVTAGKTLDIQVDGDMIRLNASEKETRSVAKELNIQIADVATIKLTPPASIAALEEDATNARDALNTLKSRFAVNNLKQAEELNEQRIEAQREVNRLKQQELVILKDANREEIEQTVTTLQAETSNYSKQRKARPDLPANAVEASVRVSDASNRREDVETSLETLQVELERMTAEHEKVDSEYRIAEQDLAGCEAALNVKRDRLEKARKGEPDDTLAARVDESNALVGKLEHDLRGLQESLLASSPDSVEALLENAKNVYDRASIDLVNEQQKHAILSDRLEQARADGRFETLEANEREFKERETTLTATRRRAQAVELLWNTLNRHRDAARRAYVRPLKEAIERLGAIVFGTGFEVELADDWSLRSRTLHGKTLPFESLSVGAREQLGILTRLAAGQIVAKQGGVPLIIDDALGFSDPGRLETMGAAIAAAGKQCQIIILTCTPGRFTHVGNAKVVKF